jgi:ribosomal subunit interface protein
MVIQFHGHQTEITDVLRVRAREGTEKLAEHLGRPVDADIWFDGDGVSRTVGVVLHAPRHRTLVAYGEGKYHGAALSEAIAKLDGQIRRMKSARKRRVRGVALRA